MATDYSQPPAELREKLAGIVEVWCRMVDARAHLARRETPAAYEVADTQIAAAANLVKWLRRDWSNYSAYIRLFIRSEFSRLGRAR